jgi:orotidine-5'-phosphate decarboxylase
MSSFRERLDEATSAHDSLLCIGIDPDPARMGTPDLFDFSRAVVDATWDLACAFKLNLAFFEADGSRGYRAMERVVEAVDGRVPVIADAKRNDIGNSARFYAKGLFDSCGFDAAVVNPYLGLDGVEPFLEYEDRGVLILCKTSNPSSKDFQELMVQESTRTIPLYEIVAERASSWDTRGNIGLVTGATFPEQARRIREICPAMPMLLPGVGAQGGELEAALSASLDGRGQGVMVNVSRGVIFASEGSDFAEAARTAAETYRSQLQSVRRDLSTGL